MLLDANNGKHIAYRKLEGKQPAIVIFGGFRSKMDGIKTTTIRNYCAEKGLQFVSFDYLGHGHSEGDFNDYTISDWRRNCATVINELTTGKLVIIGISMGGWLSMLMAFEFSERIISLICIAPAVDFCTELLPKMFTAEQADELRSKGVIQISDHTGSYKITKEFIEDGRKHLMLNEEAINLDCPICLLHGMNDRVVPFRHSVRVAEKLRSNRVEMHVVKSADHTFESIRCLDIIINSIKESIEGAVHGDTKCSK